MSDGQRIEYPIVADPDRKIAQQWGAWAGLVGGLAGWLAGMRVASPRRVRLLTGGLAGRLATCSQSAELPAPACPVLPRRRNAAAAVLVLYCRHAGLR
jgi:hypothetical protein